MTTDFSEAFGRIRPAIVGIGFSQGTAIRIIGTGFIVSESGWILTNRHVLEPLLVEKEGKIGVSSHGIVVLFAHTTPGEHHMGAIGIMSTGLEIVSFPEPQKATEEKPAPEFRGLKPVARILPPAPDVGLCKISPEKCHPAVLPLRPVSLSSDAVTEGSAVAILGFPQGLNIPRDFPMAASLQFTPLLQAGIVSGSLPFSGLPNPENYVLDIFVNGGSSGSPLFTPSGQIVGLVYATRQSFEPLVIRNENGTVSEAKDTGVYVPSALGLAVPSTRVPKDWLAQIEK